MTLELRVKDLKMSVLNEPSEKQPYSEQCMFTNERLKEDKLMLLVETSQEQPLREATQKIWAFDLQGNGLECFLLYKGAKLSGIQVYGILKDVYELYQEKGMSHFLPVVERLCEVYDFLSQEKAEKAHPYVWKEMKRWK